MLKRTLDLFVKKHWLKVIDKENDKYRKIRRKLFRQQYIINELLNEYKKYMVKICVNQQKRWVMNNEMQTHEQGS